VATGHYARVERGGAPQQNSLLRGVDEGKDQSYFLFALSQDQLAQTIFPLGKMRKNEVRDKARQLGLSVAGRAESQDICFDDYKDLVESHANEQDLGAGDIVDGSGRVLGRHKGIHGLTIGQRRGLGIAAAQAHYVIEIDQASKRVVVGSKNDLDCNGLVAERMNWIEPPVDDEFTAQVQIRYRSPAIPCVIRLTENAAFEARFTQAYPGVTPGQAAVVYHGEKLLGGGWIERAIR
jgi:tRNA-specific 2-thiouridylase